VRIAPKISSSLSGELGKVLLDWRGADLSAPRKQVKSFDAPGPPGSGSRTLEKLLRGDLADGGEMRDVGWDPESLRREYGGGSSSAE
jgi:hypothetical protein